MQNLNLKDEVILHYSHYRKNDFDKSIAVTSNIVDKAANDLGLKINRNPKWKITNISYQGKRIGQLKGLKVSTTSREAFNICRDKFRLESYLRKMEVSTLPSKLFNIDEKEKALEFIKQNNEFNYVLKPLSLAGGHGIELNISEDNFSDSWDRSIKAQKSRKVKKTACIVQPFINGFDVRVSVIEGQYSSAILRLPPYVIGDGIKTIAQLIEVKNNERLKIAYFKNKLIPINKKLTARLEKLNLSSESVLNDREILILNDISNLTLGGESVDITEELSDDIKNIAIHSVACIPGLYSGGVDIMTEDYRGDTGYIIEVNTNANHTMHHLPLKGAATRPFYDLLENMMIKHKVKNGIELTTSEQMKFAEIYIFENLKHDYNNKLFNATEY